MAGGHAWQGGMHGRGACMGWCVRSRYYEIRSMSGRYASYWNAFLFYSYFIDILFCKQISIYFVSNIYLCIVLHRDLDKDMDRFPFHFLISSVTVPFPYEFSVQLTL